jgi:hypothetical protein
MFTPAETISLITALAALAVSVRAYLVSKGAARIGQSSFEVSAADTAARQEPKLQVTNETFLSTWQRNSDTPKCPPHELDLVYSAVLTNKGDHVAAVESYVVELGVAAEPLAQPRPGFSIHVSGPLYLAAGESVVVGATVTAQHLELVRLFCELERGIVVCTLAIRYSGYAGAPRIRRVEIYRLNIEGGIVSHGPLEAWRTEPRSYTVAPNYPSASTPNTGVQATPASGRA